MKKFIDYLKSKNDKYNDIIITNVEYELSTNKLIVKAQYVCDDFTSKEKISLEKDICSFFDNAMSIECTMKKYLVDVDVVKEYILKYMEQNYPSALNGGSGAVSVEFSNGTFNVHINLDNANYSYLTSNLFDEELVDYLTLITKEEYVIKFNCVESSYKSSRDIIKQRQEQINNTEFVKAVDFDPIEVSSIHNVVGEIDVDFVYPIANIAVQEKAIIVGTVKYLKVYEYESRFKNKDGTAKVGKRVTFSLNDGSGWINCVYFPVFADEDKIENLQVGEKIIVVGDIEDREDRGLSCKVKSFGLCAFDPIVIEEPEVVWKDVNEEYKYIFPKPYGVNSQADLFAKEEIIDDFLKNNTIVVFDLETTGLDVNACEIIEIGAVKMIGGKVVESFDTLVKPKNPIPEDATAVNNITNEMVEECLGIDLVFPDFYKFIDGAVLCAYNISYDCGVLKAYGDKAGFKINNKQVDVLKLARKALPGHSSYKLARVVKQLNIELDNAHRALFDTIATAEVLKQTLNLIDPEDKKAIIGD